MRRRRFADDGATQGGPILATGVARKRVTP